MRLNNLGYYEYLERMGNESFKEGFEIGRVIVGHKERYVVGTNRGEMDAEMIGHLRFTAQSREDYPAVGDWVALTIYNDELAMIHKILPRYSTIKRQAPGKRGETQVIAANMDVAFIVQAVDRDFNINRLERYLTICNSSGVSPVIIITKIDLTDESKVSVLLEEISKRVTQIPVIAISNETREGLNKILALIEKGKTYCMLGSSGVGKSTLINHLAGRPVMETGSISTGASRGRHITSHRELIVLESGGILVDNPGMREVGITDSTGGLEMTFDRIAALSQDCKFQDCTHTNETGCAVLQAMDNGELDPADYENYLKMAKERAYFETSVAEKRKRERLFGKILKNYKKGNYKNR